MKRKKELFSVRMNAERRIYFFDVKEDKWGKKYLVISESKEFKGEYEHFRIMIFKENIEEFNRTLREAVKFMEE